MVVRALPEDLDKHAARLKWRDGHKWVDIYRQYPTIKPSAIRSAARRYKDRHGAEFGPEKASASFDESGNYAEAQTAAPYINTLDQLIEVCEVDLSVWQPQKWGVGRRSWEMGAKAVESDLTFVNGRVTGWKKQGGLKKIPLGGWSVWANFIRINPVFLFPVVQPVICNATHDLVPVPQRGGIKVSLVFADPHIGFTKDVASAKLDPFHDRRALDVVVQLAEIVQPDRIDCLGDLLDFPEMTSRFVREPEFYHTAQPAIIEANWWLQRFRDACPNAAMSLHEGNHESRIRKQMLTHLRSCAGLRPADEVDLPPWHTPERLLALHKLGIIWYGNYPNDEQWLGQDLLLSHGDVARSDPGVTTSTLAKRSGSSQIVGHIHRREMASKTIHDQSGSRTITAYSPGCVCRIDGAVPANRARMQWQQGCALVYYDPEGHHFSIHGIEIIGGVIVWGKSFLEGRDCVENLKQDTAGSKIKWNW